MMQKEHDYVMIFPLLKKFPLSVGITVSGTYLQPRNVDCLPKLVGANKAEVTCSDSLGLYLLVACVVHINNNLYFHKLLRRKSHLTVYHNHSTCRHQLWLIWSNLSHPVTKQSEKSQSLLVVSHMNGSQVSYLDG